LKNPFAFLCKFITSPQLFYVSQLWSEATTESLSGIGDLPWYKNDFLNLFGFGFEGVDYLADANEMVVVTGIT
jgi:enoyl-[acyl-carrier protein] reductase/trans-2-enoyl-CoA reductase (NAD+)